MNIVMMFFGVIAIAAGVTFAIEYFGFTAIASFLLVICFVYIAKVAYDIELDRLEREKKK